MFGERFKAKKRGVVQEANYTTICSYFPLTVPHRTPATSQDTRRFLVRKIKMINKKKVFDS